MRLLQLRWLPGRQGKAIYHKLPLFSFRLGRWGFDGYILRYPKNTLLPLHKDPVESGKHWRCNIKLWGGCVFFCMGRQILELGEFLHVFRPDLQDHGLVVIKKTYKLSFGMAKFDKKKDAVDDISGS
jgi:hypothetical protein